MRKTNAIHVIADTGDTRMKTLYIECKMGAAGDMLMAALFELLEKKQQEEFLHIMNHLFPEDVSVCAKADEKCGICGTRMEVTCHPHPHSHHSYSSILSQIEKLSLPASVRTNAAAVYRLIGDAEAKVHGVTLEQIHFHEVGSLDALCDVVGTCLLLDWLQPQMILASPIHVGNGTVVCAHGTLPVPAPATAELLKGIPYYCGEIQSELCTPTGAALLRHFVTEFLPMPVMHTQSIGIGLGVKEFSTANCVRIFMGTTEEEHTDLIMDLSCNIDDMSGEALGYTMEVLLSAGALDVFYESIQMKKNRPGILLHCFCKPKHKEKFTNLIFMHTTTRGIRYSEYPRATLQSRFEKIETPYGVVHKKISEGYGVKHEKLEYEDLRRIADEQELSLTQVQTLLST